MNDVSLVIQYLALEKRAKELEKELREVQEKAEQAKVAKKDNVDWGALKEYFR